MAQSTVEDMNQFEIEELQFRTDMQRRRTKLGMSQGELARRIQHLGLTEFHQTTVSRIEKGTRPVRLGEAHAIAKALGTSPEIMIRDELVVAEGEGILRRYKEMQEAGVAIAEAVKLYVIASFRARGRAQRFRDFSSKEDTEVIFGRRINATLELIEDEPADGYKSYAAVGVQYAAQESEGARRYLADHGLIDE